MRATQHEPHTVTSVKGEKKGSITAFAGGSNIWHESSEPFFILLCGRVIEIIVNYLGSIYFKENFI